MPTSARCERAVGRSIARTVVRAPVGQHHDLVPGPQRAAVDHAGVAPAAARLAEHPLDREAGPGAAGDAVLGRPPAGRGRLEGLEDRRPVVPGGGVGAVDDVVAVQRRDRDHGARRDPEPVGQRVHLVDDRW